ncbi:MAG: thioredoxin family protein [Candidatus Auribacter fodinae]|jgi:peroxiredoxin|uniref:Thioredoxin family protein n=1 Tax=Candidatus Auribacter fodinae TaxID=2093366 RepID=A0A3A4R0Q8_9BACT|nr:MAG: thioredoxin family protein [Candidatus Auribacter fodinae]
MLLESKKIELGTPVVEFALKGVDGKIYTPSSFAGASALVVVVTCNHCPYAKASWPLLIRLQAAFKEEGVQFVAVNPNDDDAYPEDSFERMKENAKALALNFPYLRDDTQSVARNLGAVCTPDIYVYDSSHKLYYHGRINDNWQDPNKVREQNLKDAIERLLRGDVPPLKQPPSIGCSIKWK